MIRSTIVTGETLTRIKHHAERAWINGRSHVRGGDRVQRGMEDQLVGQLGEYALAKYLGVEDTYFARRERIDSNRFVGDEGSDVDGLQVDVKSSMMRGSNKPMRYNLLVRPAERHPGTIYVLALVCEADDGYKTYLVGYTNESELPDEPEISGVFAGAYRLHATKLHDIASLKSATL